jgi:hypothetical protein
VSERAKRQREIASTPEVDKESMREGREEKSARRKGKSGSDRTEER